MLPNEPDTTMNVIAAGVASKSTYAGSALTLGGWALSNEFAVLFGLVMGLAGFAVNLTFKLKEDRRQADLHRLRMAALLASGDDLPDE